MYMIAVYKIVNKVDGKVYVGSSIDVERRFKSHKDELNKGTHNNKHLQRAWDKYGEDNFDFIIVEEVIKENLRERETYYIQKYDCTNHTVGYNMLNNSNIGLGVKASEEVRHKISEACTGSKNGNYGHKLTDEQRAYMRDRRWGVGYICKPKKSTYKRKTPEEIAESRKRMSKLAKERKLSEETREKIRQYRLGKKANPELRQKFSQMRKGENNSNSKLTKNQVLEIYEKMNSGINYKEVCKEYGIGQCLVYKIKRKEHWVFNDSE